MNLSILVLILPFLTFVGLAFFGKRLSGITAGIIGSISTGIISLIAAFIAFNYWVMSDGKSTMILFNFPWLTFNEHLAINMGLLLDSLSIMMVAVVTFVSFMVHLYSIEYLKGEERYGSYFAYLSLFTFSMLGLVLSVNIFQIYVFWELVGVSSFLLIGFYYQRPSAVAAAKKAFIVTRFADLGFLVGILILSFEAKTLDIPMLIERLSSPDTLTSGNIKMHMVGGLSVISIAMFLIFIGGAGKSAMFPLHIWLPDAMEGPTPVSALIHAATMVVAGVYLVARLFPVYFVLTPEVLHIISWVGIISALLAALIACTQTDIKRVLAYSTISQIGYMMFSLGITAYSHGETLGYTASLFHLFTHAFFKALLFLAAGVIIHAVHSNEVAQMGGLRKSLPTTHIAFLLATLAISGIPPLSGFFSKEAILTATHHANPVIFWLAVIGSSLTTFYMFRLYYLIFWNKPAEHHRHHEHALFSIPLIILTLGTLLNGFIPFGQFISVGLEKVQISFELGMAAVPVGGSLLAILLATLWYAKSTSYPDKFVSLLKNFYRWTYRKFYFDELYQFVTHKIIFNLIGRPIAWFDRNIVDGTMNAMAWGSMYFSQAIKRIQSGNVQSYTMYFLGGVIILLSILLYAYGYNLIN
ncbi:MAG TPA: NADH-quinone oxidoreductase subunit L [Bacteroidales bacterium]|nr:NADH-quinone oxidoreductase subunit L [Bacteroidales bacterium]HPO65960.1 NADH-quinone oxidoreductase subunit L [Bacteroidales bacterium]